MREITERAYAKLNLSLDVTGRREDGYHDMLMLMQTVSLCDTLRLRFRDDGKVCAVCTDVGHITPEVDSALEGCRFVLIESNYDEGMLRHGSYPIYLKERILSPIGHLSNNDCGVQVKRMIEHGTTHILLGHLSPENNTPDIAYSTVRSHLGGAVSGRDYIMGVAPMETQGGAVIF